MIDKERLYHNLNTMKTEPDNVVQKRLFTISEYYKMADSQILQPNEKVELIEGEIYKKMSPIGAMHAYCVDYFIEVFSAYTERNTSFKVRGQNPVSMPDNTEPEPDIALVKNKVYKESHPIAEDVYLIIEVSESTYTYDRYTKLPIYAKYYIPEVWILDLNKNCLEVFINPIFQQKSYQNRMVFEKGKVSSIQFTDIVIDLDEIFC